MGTPTVSRMNGSPDGARSSMTTSWKPLFDPTAPRGYSALEVDSVGRSRPVPSHRKAAGDVISSNCLVNRVRRLFVVCPGRAQLTQSQLATFQLKLPDG